MKNCKDEQMVARTGLLLLGALVTGGLFAGPPSANAQGTGCPAGKWTGTWPDSASDAQLSIACTDGVMAWNYESGAASKSGRAGRFPVLAGEIGFMQGADGNIHVCRARGTKGAEQLDHVTMVQPGRNADVPQKSMAGDWRGFWGGISLYPGEATIKEIGDGRLSVQYSSPTWKNPPVEEVSPRNGTVVAWHRSYRFLLDKEDRLHGCSAFFYNGGVNVGWIEMARQEPANAVAAQKATPVPTSQRSNPTGARVDCPEGHWEGSWMYGRVYGAFVRLHITCEDGKVRWEHTAWQSDSRPVQRGESARSILRINGLGGGNFIRGIDNRIHGCTSSTWNVARGSVAISTITMARTYPPPLPPLNPQGVNGRWTGNWDGRSGNNSLIEITTTRSDEIAIEYWYRNQKYYSLAKVKLTRSAVFSWEEQRFFFVLGADDRLYGCRAFLDSQGKPRMNLIVMERE